MMDVTVAQPVELATSDSPETARSDRTARFAELLTANWDRAYRLAYHLTGNRADADDLVQQASEEAFLAFDRFQPGTRFDRWLLRILHNSFLDHARRDRRRRMVPLDDVTVPAPREGTGDPDAAMRDLIEGPVRAALLHLPVEFRAAVVLVDLEGMTYEEVSHILRLPIGTVRSRLHRARLALREWLRSYVDAVSRGEL